MQNTLSAIPLNRSDASRFFSAFAGATDQQLLHVQLLIDTLPAEMASTFVEEVMPICFDERFLSMVCESKRFSMKLTTPYVVSLLRNLTSKAQALLIDEDFHEKLASALLRGFGGADKDSLLPHIVGIVGASVPGDHQVKLGSTFDEALSIHVRNTPYRSRDEIRLSWKALQAHELPSTLETFSAQLIAGGEYGYIEIYIVDAFKSDSFPSSYVDLFRRTLGEDVVISLCAEAHRVFDVPFSSVQKIMSWAGEQPFHTEKFLAAQQKALRGKGAGRTAYLDGFSIAGADEVRFPVFSSFALQNMKSILREPRELADNKYIVPVMTMAARCGKGRQALKFMMDGMMRRNLSTFIDGLDDAKPDEVVQHMSQSVEGSMPRASVMAHWSLLLRTVEALGLETLKEVIPDVDGLFIQRFLESKETPLSKGVVLKMFPQAKRAVLENDLGL